MTKDAPQALAFYQNVFGYSAAEMPIPNGTYYMLSKDDVMRAGLMQNPNPAAPSAWIMYVMTHTIEASYARAIELGATGLVPPSEVAAGSFALLFDPQGAVFGVWQSAGIQCANAPQDTAGRSDVPVDLGAVAPDHITPEPQTPAL